MSDKKKPDPKKHDASYKLIFSHPESVADLLKGFVKGEWLNELDFDSLEKVSGIYTPDDLRERLDDSVCTRYITKKWTQLNILKSAS